MDRLYNFITIASGTEETFTDDIAMLHLSEEETTSSYGNNACGLMLGQVGRRLGDHWQVGYYRLPAAEEKIREALRAR